MWCDDYSHWHANNTNNTIISRTYRRMCVSEWNKCESYYFHSSCRPKWFSECYQVKNKYENYTHSHEPLRNSNFNSLGISINRKCGVEMRIPRMNWKWVSKPDRRISVSLNVLVHVNLGGKHSHDERICLSLKNEAPDILLFFFLSFFLQL